MKASLDPFDILSRPVEIYRRADGERMRSVKMVRPTPSSIYIARRFLEGQESHIEAAGKVSLPSLLLRPCSLTRDCDLLIARVSRRVSRMMAMHDVIRVPELVRFVMPLPISDEERRRIKSAQSENLRRIRKHNLSCSLSQADEDFEFLWHEMVLPYTQSRFGDLTQRYTYDYARKVFNRGMLLFVLQDDRKIAGALLDLARNGVRALSLGANGDFEHAVRIGALSALYHFTIEWAEREGYDSFDMGTVRPCIADGIFRTKYRWGGHAAEDEDCQDLVLHWRNGNPLVRQFFANSPLVMRDGEKLSAIGALPQEAEHDRDALKALVERNLVPGLDRMFVLSDLAGRSDSPSRATAEANCWTAPLLGPRSSIAAAKPLAL